MIPANPTLAFQLAELFTAIADPTRAHLLLLIRQQPQRSTDLAQALEMTPSATSHQLRWLRERNLIQAQKTGREVYYSLADACIRDLLETAIGHIEEGNSPSWN